MNQVSKLEAASPNLVQVMQAPEAEGEDTIDIRGLFATLWRGKYIIAICGFIAAVLAVLTVSQFEPRYKASAKVMFDIQKANVANLDQILIDQEFSKDTLQNQIEILRSTTLIERVVNDLNLDQNAEFNPKLRVESETFIDRLRQTFSFPPEIRDVLMDIGVISLPPLAPDAEETARRERLTIIGNVQKGLSLSPVRGSRVIEVSFTSSNPKTAARVVNSMANQYIVDQLEAKLETTRSATAWLSIRVSELQSRVEEAEDAVEKARTRLSLEAGQGLEITNQQLEALNATLTITRSSISRVDAQYTRLTDAVENNLDLGAIPEFRDSKLIQGFRETESDLLAQEINLKATVPEGHPALTRLQARIEETQRNINAEAARIISATKVELDALEAQEITLAQDVRELETQALSQSANQVELRQLEREANASRALYENFLSRQQETTAQEDLQNADARILSPAEPPILAESQRKRIIVWASTLLGLMAGVAIIFLLDRLNNTFRAPPQIEELTGYSVLATVPGTGSRMKRSAVVKTLREKPNGALAESVRNLRTSILFSNLDNPPKVVMFTSSTPREGKSTTSMMMAMTSRQMGKSAVIVDCDLRMPALAKVLQVNDDAPGLLSVMDGTAQIKDALYREEETGLHVLMAKPNERPAQLNAADILSSQKFKSLIEGLSQHYDLVILDTPPTLVVTDARIVSQICDAVVYAVRWDQTPRDAVIEGLKELKTVDAPITGVVLTMVNETKASKYVYDGYSYYKGRYRDYYEA